MHVFTSLILFIESVSVRGCYGSKQSETCIGASDRESVEGGNAILQKRTLPKIEPRTAVSVE